MRTLILATGLSIAAAGLSPADAQTLDFLIAETDRTQLLAQLLEAAGFSCALAEEGPYTVFAPTDNGFDIVPEEAIADLRDPANRHVLRGVLSYHVVPGAYDTQALAVALESAGGGPISLPTLHGDSLQLSYGDERYLLTDALGNTVNLSEPGENYAADNGVLHLTVGVLMPTAESVFDDQLADCAGD